MPSLAADSRWLLLSGTATAGSVSLLSAGGAVCLFMWLSKRFQCDTALVATCASYLGTIAFPYSTMLYSHSLTLSLLCAGLLSASEAHVRRGCIGASLDIVAGFLIGYAIASEYSAGLVGMILLFSLPTKGATRMAMRVLAATIPAGFVLAYNRLCFGNPFTVSYSYEAVFTAHNTGFFGIGLPLSVETWYLYVLSPSRGLLFWSPVYVLFIPGFGLCLNRACARMAIIAYMCLVVQTVLLNGYQDPCAGESIGPRYLTPCFAPGAYLVAAGIARYPRLGLALVIISIAMMTVATLLDAQFPCVVGNPFLRLYPALIAAGKFQVTLPVLFSMPGWSGPFVLVCWVCAGGTWFYLRALAERRRETGQSEVSLNALQLPVLRRASEKRRL